jgi:hypothetical protein
MVVPIMKKNTCGGIIITKTNNSINNNFHNNDNNNNNNNNDNISIIMGKTNNNLNTFENFGGHPQSSDISSFHTAIREFIEEFFNFLPSTDLVNHICNILITNSLIIAQIEFMGVSYLIDFSTLNIIFISIINFIPNSPLVIYLVNNKFDHVSFFSNRIITDKPSNGLNEIHSIHIIPINDILHNKYKLRKFSRKIINLFF